ncbi:MAG: sigma-54-dependent transcriptional regulator [Candidatus Binataceae bacterium]
MTAGQKILIAEDDRSTREAWCEIVGSWGFRAQAAADGRHALELIDRFDPSIILLDLDLPEKHGIEVLSELREKGVVIPTIVISGTGEIADAVKSIKLGAYDYLCKPVDPSHLHVLLDNLSAHLAIGEENQRLRQRLIRAGELGPLIGQSLAMRRVMTLVDQVAPSSAPVVISGESGTGKELVARTVHELSARRNGPFVAINCAAVPETLMESELFGHERGAFTGADRRREGCFELADGGTLLLDEIGEMKVELQAKLLRVLEERKIRRIGGGAEIPVDVRVLASTNRNPQSAMNEGRFREDLYYRLNVFAIELPALRERIDDIPVLVEHFLGQLTPPEGKAVTGLEAECLEALKASRWPGNVRQLRNAVQHALIVTRGPLISTGDLPIEVTRTAANNGSPLAFEVRPGVSLDELERHLILRTIEFTGGNKSRAAEILGVSVKTLYNRLERYRTKEGVQIAGEN